MDGLKSRVLSFEQTMETRTVEIITGARVHVRRVFAENEIVKERQRGVWKSGVHMQRVD